jgi:molybdenum-dependent DNA-binding transcriptional regulator ModE
MHDRKGRSLNTLNLDQVASFLAIARLKSFRAAARELEISQGAISQQLQKLENLLVPSCVRTPRLSTDGGGAEVRKSCAKSPQPRHQSA